MSEISRYYAGCGVLQTPTIHDKERNKHAENEQSN
jgi:hypothetical protein